MALERERSGPVAGDVGFGVMEVKKSSLDQFNKVAPFVAKTYEMVSDPRTDVLIRWGRGNNSFLVLDSVLFSQYLLPSYFKHSNYSSFVRQLNTYGFRKVDPERWEFAHESFLRGQTQLLPLIIRRRRKEDGNIAVERDGAEAEEKDETTLMQEVEQLRREQRVLEEELEGMNRRLQATEKRPQQMISFLSKLADDPDFLPRLIISKKEQQKQQQDLTGNKKRRLLVPPPPPPPPPPQPSVPSFQEKPFPTLLSGYNDGVAAVPATPNTSSFVVDPGGSQMLFLQELQVPGTSSPATGSSTFPFSLLGEGFF